MPNAHLSKLNMRPLITGPKSYLQEFMMSNGRQRILSDPLCVLGSGEHNDFKKHEMRHSLMNRGLLHKRQNVFKYRCLQGQNARRYFRVVAHDLDRFRYQTFFHGG